MGFVIVLTTPARVSHPPPHGSMPHITSYKFIQPPKGAYAPASDISSVLRKAGMPRLLAIYRSCGVPARVQRAERIHRPAPRAFGCATELLWFSPISGRFLTGVRQHDCRKCF